MKILLSLIVLISHIFAAEKNLDSIQKYFDLPLYNDLLVASNYKKMYKGEKFDESVDGSMRAQMCQNFSNIFGAEILNSWVNWAKNGSFASDHFSSVFIQMPLSNRVLKNDSWISPKYRVLEYGFDSKVFLTGNVLSEKNMLTDLIKIYKITNVRMDEIRSVILKEPIIGQTTILNSGEIRFNISNINGEWRIIDLDKQFTNSMIRLSIGHKILYQ